MIMKNKSFNLKEKALLAFAMATAYVENAFGQDAGSLVTNIKSKAVTVGSNIILLVQVVVCIVAAVMLIQIIVDAMKPQSQSRDGLIKWFGVLIIVFLALQLVKVYIK